MKPVLIVAALCCGALFSGCVETRVTARYANGTAWSYDSSAFLQDVSGASMSVSDASGYSMTASVNAEIRPEGQSATSETARTAIRVAAWLIAGKLALSGNLPAAGVAAAAGEAAHWLSAPQAD